MSVEHWKRDAGIEPRLRVGIFLDADEQGCVNLRVPDNHYAADGVRPTPIAVRPHTDIEIRRTGTGLAVTLADKTESTDGPVRLTPTSPRPLLPASGLLVREVVAGRGFHWQKRIDQTLSGTIELSPGERGIVLVNELPLEEYLAGVITAEMSGACPAEFLKAQCVVARSWLLAMTEHKHDHEPFDRCNDDCCQRYQGTGALSASAIGAVRSTRGLALVDPAGNVLDANYSKSCGGVSETPEAVWGIAKAGLSVVVDAPDDADEQRFFPITDWNLPEYLDGEWLNSTRIFCGPQVVPPDAVARFLGQVDEVDDYFRWTVRYDRRELEELLRDKLPEARHLAELYDVRVMQRGVSGRAIVVELEWTDTNDANVVFQLQGEYRIREALHRKFLYSSAFLVRTERDAGGRPETFTLRGAGWGHGVGLCQIGALGMALSGSEFAAICRHYYPETSLQEVYE